VSRTDRSTSRVGEAGASSTEEIMDVSGRTLLGIRDAVAVATFAAIDENVSDATYMASWGPTFAAINLTTREATDAALKDALIA
jgi:hypothetical protein